MKAGAWDVVAHAGIRRLRGQTLGLLGFGKIAKALASKVQPLGMKVLVYDPYLDPALIAQHGAEAVGLDRLLAEADAISIHVPLSPETRNLIGQRELAQMKPAAFLINTSRGGIVDEQALAAALKEAAGRRCSRCAQCRATASGSSAAAGAEYHPNAAPGILLARVGDRASDQSRRRGRTGSQGRAATIAGKPGSSHSPDCERGSMRASTVFLSQLAEGSARTVDL